MGNTSKADLSTLWEDLLGCKKTGSFQSEKCNCDEDILTIGHGPYAVEVDLMQPIDVNRSPKVHVPALNHIGLWVDDLHAAVESLTESGVRFAPGGIRAGAVGYDVIYIHPKANEASPHSGCGVLIELVQAPPDVIAAHPPKQE